MVFQIKHHKYLFLSIFIFQVISTSARLTSVKISIGLSNCSLDLCKHFYRTRFNNFIQLKDIHLRVL